MKKFCLSQTNNPSSSSSLNERLLSLSPSRIMEAKSFRFGSNDDKLGTDAEMLLLSNLGILSNSFSRLACLVRDRREKIPRMATTSVFLLSGLLVVHPPSRDDDSGWLSLCGDVVVASEERVAPEPADCLLLRPSDSIDVEDRRRADKSSTPVFNCCMWSLRCSFSSLRSLRFMRRSRRALRLSF